MNGFLQNVVRGCISYTFSCLFYLIFSLCNIFPPFDETMLINMFLISFVIVGLITIIHLTKIQSMLILRFIEVSIVMVVLFLAGIFLDMFPLTWFYIGFVLMIGIVTYVFVVGITFILNQAKARQINSFISRRNSGV